MFVLELFDVFSTGFSVTIGDDWTSIGVSTGAVVTTSCVGLTFAGLTGLIGLIGLVTFCMFVNDCTQLFCVSTHGPKVD